MIRRIAGIPLVWQTMLLIVVSIAIAQAIGFLLLILSPPPRPDFNRMGDIVTALSGTAAVDRDRDHGDRDRGDRERVLTVHHQATPPGPRMRMVTDAGLVHLLAERLHVRDQDVRLWFEPDKPRNSLFDRRRPSVYFRHGDQMFFTPIVAGLQHGEGWTVAQTPPPPLILPWQRRFMVWFVVSAIALSPLAWLFARAVTRPIRRFADAANRLGEDPLAPPVEEEEGPSEMRVTAHALNRMQSRLSDYVGERTAMIGAIAHDLRTPLARIAFRIEGAPDPIREKVLADVEQMRAMLSATIGFVKSTDSGGMRVAVDLSAMLGALVLQETDLGRAVASDGLASAPVLADPLALERLLQNLIDNGIAYGGGVTVSTRVEDGRAIASIADAGPGMEAEMLTRAFQPFVRGDPSRNRDTGGIGLGLTIARTIAENHGGTLVLANRERGGLEATLSLPLAA